MIPLSLLASQLLIDAILDPAFFEVAIRHAHTTTPIGFGALTRNDLLGIPRVSEWTALCSDDDPTVRVRLDRWIVEAIAELVESRDRSRIRAFVRDAVLAYFDQVRLAGTAK